jgi:hypothetical protein
VPEITPELPSMDRPVGRPPTTEYETVSGKPVAVSAVVGVAGTCGMRSIAWVAGLSVGDTVIVMVAVAAPAPGPDSLPVTV